MSADISDLDRRREFDALVIAVPAPQAVPLVEAVSHRGVKWVSALAGSQFKPPLDISETAK